MCTIIGFRTFLQLGIIYLVWAVEHTGHRKEIHSFLRSLIADDAKGFKKIERKVFLDTSSLTPVTVGKGIDLFLTTRPWWWVEKEPYRWKDSNRTGEYEILLHRFGREWDPLFEQLVAFQYPPDCAEVPLHAFISGFDSYGNSFFNYVHHKTSHFTAVVIPYLRSDSISFLDKDSCPHIKNRFECAFLPPTNCSIPNVLLTGKENSSYFEYAGKHANNLQLSKFSEIVGKSMSGMSRIEMNITQNITSGLFKGKLQEWTSNDRPVHGHSFGLFFAYAMLYRLNHHYRSLVAQYVHEWRAKLLKPFPDDGDCVAVIIRRGDRLVENQNMFEWCEKYKIYPNGSCYNDQTGKVEDHANCVRFYDYGCNSGMPFGEMSLAHVLNASRIVSNSKNVLICSEDSKWLAEQIKITPTDLNLFLTTPVSSSSMRSSSAGGVQYMSAIKLASTCPALVGHTNSAVTMFFYNIMCVRSAGRIGVCPRLYTFSEG